MRTFILICVVSVLSLFSSLTFGQDGEKTSKELLRKAYELSQQTPATAETAAETIKLCEEALQVATVEEQRTYAKKLVSWAYTVHGELALNDQFDLPVAERDEEKLHKGVDDLNRAVEFDSTSSRALVARASAHALKEDWKLALDDLNAALKLKPGHPKALFNRAEIRYAIGDNVLAIDDYTQVLASQPRDVESYTGRGHAYFRLGQFQKAFLDYHKVCLISSKTMQALVNRGDAYAASGNFEKAVSDYEDAIRIDDKSAQPLQRLAWLKATSTDERFANAAQALAMAKKATELAPNDVEVKRTMASALAANGQFEEAVAILDQLATDSANTANSKFQADKEHFTKKEKTPFESFWR